MNRTFHATYDGEVLRPEEPLDLPAHHRYRVTIEDEGDAEDHPLLRYLALAQDLGVDDLAEQHDHYLHGLPKR